MAEQEKRDLTICCIGDSLTEGDYGIKGKSGIANVHRENYPFYLAKELGCRTKNFGKCGFKATDYLKFYRDGNVDLAGADVVLVMLGTNGGHRASAVTEENIAYEELIGEIRADAPEAKLILLTPPHATENPEMSNCGYHKQVQEAAGFVRQFAEREKLPLIDVAHYDRFCAETENIYQANDGLHFVDAGYRQLAAFLAERIREIIHVHGTRDFAEHGHYHSPEEKKRQLNRISRAVGHLSHVKTMIENDEDCAEVLNQLSAVNAALRNLGKEIISEHMTHCITHAIEEGDMEAVEEFQKAVQKFL
jgi:DNA-binding FrmR family transcriptional regulator/lysophospholipase L1-like esterase